MASRFPTPAAALIRRAVRPDPAPSVPRPDPVPGARPARPIVPRLPRPPIEGASQRPTVPVVTRPITDPARVATGPQSASASAPVGGVPGATAPVALPPSLDSLIDADWRYIAQAPRFASQQNELYTQFGWVPDPNSPSGYRMATAAEQPYSQAQAIIQALARRSADVTNNNNAHGLLYSGAQVGQQQAAQSASEQDTAQAFAQLLRQLGGIEDSRSDLRFQIGTDLMNKPAPDTGATSSVAQPSADLARIDAASPAQRTGIVQTNQWANGELQRRSGVTGLAQLYNEAKAKGADQSVLLAIDAKLKAARAKGAK